MADMNVPETGRQGGADGRQDAIGCRSILEWCAVILFALGVFAFIPTSGTGYQVFLAGWLAIVTASLMMTSVGLAAAIDRVAPAGGSGPRGALTVVATLAVAGLAAWSLWLTVGPPAVGTLSEATPLLVDPPIAAVVAMLTVRRSNRTAVFAFIVATIAIVITLARFVAVVGPTYSG